MIKFLLTIATLTISSSSLFADTPTGADNTAKEIPVRKKGVPDNRPQLPSRQHVECVYAYGVLHFDFTVPEGEAVLTVTDAQTGISSQYYFDTDAHAEVNIGYLSAASLEIHTDAGNIYEGIIDL